MSRSLRWYVWSVVAAGAIALAALAPHLHLVDRGGLLLWLGLLLAADLFPLPSPVGGSAFTGAAPITFASVLLFGPTIGALFGAASALITDGLKRRCAPHRILFNTGQLVLALGFAGILYQLLGGTPAPGRANSIYDPGWADLLIAVTAYTALLVLNFGLVSVAIALSEGTSPLTILRANYIWLFPSNFHVPLTSFLFTLLYLRVGVWAVFLFLAWILLYTRSLSTILEIKVSTRRTLGMLASATDAAVPQLRGRSESVAALATRIAREMGLSWRRREQVEFAALLHNVGFLAVDRRLLLAPHPLDEAEREQIRTHVLRGAGIVEKVPAFRRVAEVVRSQEERPDGTGYPRGLRGDDIPLEARVLRVAAAYEAMTAGGPNQRGIPSEDALRALEAEAGSAYDAQVVAAAVRLGRGGHLPVLAAPGTPGAREGAG